MIRIMVTGGGWYGCHLASELAKMGHEVVLVEAKSEILNGISGNFGVRLHRGPHYPRSDKTREFIHEAYDKFCEAYPELILKLEKSVYALGKNDIAGNSSRVTREVFERVCNESGMLGEVDLNDSEFSNVEYAANIDENFIVVGSVLRDFFKEKLSHLGVRVHYNSEITKIAYFNSKIAATTKDGKQFFIDKVINCTGFQKLFSPSEATKTKQLPPDMDVVYQPCVALFYKDTMPSEKPFAFIVMDGELYPCIMPYCNEKPFQNTYLVTNGQFTRLGSYKTHEHAKDVAESTKNNKELITFLKDYIERSISEFMPNFKQRFKFYGWHIDVLPKLKTTRDFRSTVTYEYDGIINVFPGKISDIFKVTEEVNKLLGANCGAMKGFRFAENGVYTQSIKEIAEKPLSCEVNQYNIEDDSEEISGNESITKSFQSKPDSMTDKKSPLLINSIYRIFGNNAGGNSPPPAPR